jgi:hypothetical protein
MPANDREVFEYLTADQSTPIEIDMLTFAIFANEKHEWMKLSEQQKGRPPTQDEIDDWTSNLTDWRVAQMRHEAAQFFDISARAYLGEEIAAGKEEVLRSSLIREVKAAGSFWKQMTIALATAILAPLIIGGVIAFALTYDRIVPTIGSVSERLRTPGNPVERAPAPEAPR